MPNIITDKIKLRNAIRFKNLVNLNQNSSLYFYLGRPNPWSNDNEPPIPGDNPQEDAKIWDEILGLKKLLPSDIKHVVKRVDWKYDTVYDQYDDEDEELFNKVFYVMNSTYDVYKCISNNRRSKSLVEPSGKSLNIFTSSDGYRWKYLYSISAADQLKFLTRNWMPVDVNADVSAFAKDGGIEHIIINNGGIDYSSFSKVRIDGDGKNANIGVRTRLGVIQDFAFNNSGTQYRNANAYIFDPTGSGYSSNIRAIINPVGGHGFDPISELNAHTLMFNTKTDYNEGFEDFPPEVKFRRLGIIDTPEDAYGNPANALTLNGLYSIQFDNVTGIFVKDEYILANNSLSNLYCVTANVISSNAIIKYIQSIDSTRNFNTPNIGELMVGLTSGATGIVKTLRTPEVLHDTGSIIYVENRTPVTRSVDQSEILHLVIEF